MLPELIHKFDSAAPSARYFEPFIGGGALFFELVRTGRLGRKKAVICDNNKNLIDVYEAVKTGVDEILETLASHKRRHCETYYYKVRDQAPNDLYERAARIIYLNKTCFNGLYRENSKGKFNVPVGSYKNPTIADESNLRAAAHALNKAYVEHDSFDLTLDRVEQGDFVYFDPPYHPLSKTASFTAYSKNGFGVAEQEKLARIFRVLHERGAKLLLSNSKTPLIRELYTSPDFKLSEVYATRRVNSRADRRGKIPEILVTNF